MAIRAYFLPAGLEAVHFKETPEGWLFTTANPWVFAPSRTYLVNNEQKESLGARIRLARALRLVFVLPWILLLIAVYVAYPSLARTNSIASWATFGAFCLSMEIIFKLCDYLVVRGLLRGVPRSAQKVRPTEMLRIQGQAMSVRALAIFTSIFTAGLIANVSVALTLSGGSASFAVIGAVAMGLFAVSFGGSLLNKLRTRKLTDTKTESTIEPFTTRLERLENSGDFILPVLVTIITVMGVMLVTQITNRSGMLTTAGLILRNNQGDAVARLQTVASGRPWLFLYGADKKLRASLGLADDGDLIVSLDDTKGHITWLAVAGDKGVVSKLSNRSDRQHE